MTSSTVQNVLLYKTYRCITTVEINKVATLVKKRLGILKISNITGIR